MYSWPAGRLDFNEFIKRLPCRSNFYCHRFIGDNDIRPDWKDRLLRLDDKDFLYFLCATIHPECQSDNSVVSEWLKIYNKSLEIDGYIIFDRGDKVAGRPIYFYKSINKAQAIISQHNIDKINRSQVRDKIDKCWKSIYQGKYKDAIKDSNILIEACLEDIYKQITGEAIQLTQNEKNKRINN